MSSQGRKQFGTKHTELIRKCLIWLKEQGIYAWSNKTGCLFINGRPIRYGLPGSSDILGVISGGKILGVECKVKPDKPKPLQLRFAEQINDRGGVAIVVYSVEELADKLGGYL